MENVHLLRFAYTPFGVFGTLHYKDFTCFTVECPWVNNARSISCIPEGVYSMRLGMFFKGGYPAYELMGVPERSAIKIHKGNTMDDIEGCICPGERLGFLSNKWAVLNSGVAFKKFMDALNGVDIARIHVSQYTH